MVPPCPRAGFAARLHAGIRRDPHGEDADGETEFMRAPARAARMPRQSRSPMRRPPAHPCAASGTACALAARIGWRSSFGERPYGNRHSAAADEAEEEHQIRRNVHAACSAGSNTSGRSSARVTAPETARSMAGQRSAGTVPRPATQ